MTDTNDGSVTEQVAIGPPLFEDLPLPEGAKPVEAPSAKPEPSATPQPNTAPNAAAPKSIADAIAPGGQLPGLQTNSRSQAREMPPSLDPNAAAQQFVDEIKNGQTPLSVTPIPAMPGAYYEQLSADTYITLRPTGAASSKTSSETATVEINDPKINALNGGHPLELKFPKLTK
jgi:hypothetical protein